MFQRQTKQKVEEKNEQKMFVWRQMTSEFKQKWPQIKSNKRVEVHINSLSIDELKRISMEKFLQRENSQISRIFAAGKDPNLEIIYVCPY